MRFGCVCDNGPSHVMASAAIGRALVCRGHEFVLFGFSHLSPWIEKEGIACSYLPHSSVLAQHLAISGKGGDHGPQQIVQALVQSAEFLHQELPPAMQEAKVDCMMVDANLPAAASVAEAQALRFVTFCCALPPHEEPAVPPAFLDWSYNAGLWGKLRNRSFYLVRDYLIRPLIRELNLFRQQQGLRPYRKLSDALSPIAQITQLVAEFDFPRTKLPAYFHYVGPYVRRKNTDVSFPFELLDGRPLVYAALGTVLGETAGVWASIAEACAPLGVQLVIALGSSGSTRTLGALAGNPIVVPYAPQEELLARASLFITHAGLNSVLESLAHGVPMVAMPFIADQMGIASRIAYRGVGRTLGRHRKVDSIGRAVKELIADPGYRERSLAIGRSIKASGGADRAAEVIEEVASHR